MEKDYLDPFQISENPHYKDPDFLIKIICREACNEDKC